MSGFLGGRIGWYTLTRLKTRVRRIPRQGPPTSLSRHQAQRLVIGLATVFRVIVIYPSMGLSQTIESTEARNPPPYTPLIWDIDWKRLKETGKDDTPYHFIRLGSDSRYLSLIGQIREHGEYQDHPEFGLQHPDNGYFQQRYLASADLHLGQHTRGFLQLGSSFTSFRDGGPRPSIDQSRLDINQGFIDVATRQASPNLVLRIGRQLLAIGSSRMIAAGTSLNVEQPFDGFRTTLLADDWIVDLLAVRPVAISNGPFTNKPDHSKSLWGAYASRNISHVIKLDLYYVGLDAKSTHYVQGSSREQRETFGARLSSQTSLRDGDIEFTGQTGAFGSDTIRAWSASGHFGRTLTAQFPKPHLELNAGIHSGDHNPSDRCLGTFNPLFPDGNYLGESITLGPTNLAVVRPAVRLEPTHQLALNANFEMLWREARKDGLYDHAGNLLYTPAASLARHVGSQIQTELRYSPGHHIIASLVFEHFFAGPFLRQNPPGKSLNFLSPQVSWNF